MKIVVGCPIRNRAWIFPEWLENVRIAFEIAGETPTWAFDIGLDQDGKDDGTCQMVTELLQSEPGLRFMTREIQEIPETRRPWTIERYQGITKARNDLLSLVRLEKPDYFLSVDSDILLHPTALVCLLESIKHRNFDAVAGKAYLGAHRNIVTYAMHHPNGGLRRIDQDGVFPVEIIMALKLMTPAAYNIDYAFNRYGEDIGWSDACRAAGLTLGFDGRVCSKHVMYPEKLHEVDPRVGW